MDIIEFLLAQNTYKRYLRQKQFQITMINFLPTRQVMLKLAPNEQYTALYYRLLFGEAMIPHQFSTLLVRENDNLFGGIVSGQIIDKPIKTFSLVAGPSPLQLTVTNLRNTVGYFELTIFYIEINRGDDYNDIIADIKLFTASVSGGAA